MYGMMQQDPVDNMWKHVKKPTTFMTNAGGIATRLSRQCKKIHKHINLIGGKAKAAEVYPDQLCQEIIRGLMDTMRQEGRLRDTAVGCVFAVEEGEARDSTPTLAHIGTTLNRAQVSQQAGKTRSDAGRPLQFTTGCTGQTTGATDLRRRGRGHPRQSVRL